MTCEHCWNKPGQLRKIGNACLCLCAACYVWLANMKRENERMR